MSPSTLFFENYLIPKLKDAEYAKEYLETALETYAEDRDVDALLGVIQDVVFAQGAFEQTEIYEEHCTGCFLKKARPVLAQLGYRLEPFSVHTKASIMLSEEPAHPAVNDGPSYPIEHTATPA